ncbi:MAG: hypothetical protein GY711_29600 [bacterium]|nr:hypothetical protein [bacterium]
MTWNNALSAALAIVCTATASAQLTVTTTQPAMNAGNVAANAEIVVDFDRAVTQAAIAADAVVFGKNTGTAAGAWTTEAAGTRARFTPASAFAAGEVVGLTLSENLMAMDGTFLRTEGFTAEFRVRTRPNTLQFTHIGTMNVRTTPSQGTRVYGGQATDLNGDGWLDLAIVNQDSSDVRVLMNQTDGTGAYDDFLQPTTGTGSTPSPNESADMNGDGVLDIVTANKVGDTVSVLLGNGDGTFQTRIDEAVGDLPRGLALLDMDGDGDTDVVTANANSSDMSLLFNDGTGNLSPQVTMQGGGSGEWGLAAGDMNEDGIMDLVVGARTSERVIVWLGNGDGTFTQSDLVNGTDGVWMIVLGDVNGDGHLDVSTGNGTSNSGAILLGDGSGNLSLHQMMPAPSFVVATDLGDLDGDGDLDWVLSSFSGSRWTLYENDGAGNFVFQQFWSANDNAADAVMLDFDNDMDLDLVLLDEIADEVVLMENTCPALNFCTPIANSTGVAAIASMTGSCAIAENDFQIHAGPVPDNFGLIFYGLFTTNGTPVGNGNLCLSNPVYRSDVALATGGLLTVPIDLDDPPVPAATILPGSTWDFQAVYRDVSAGGAEFNFSDGLAVTFL